MGSRHACGKTLWGFTTEKQLPLARKVLVHTKDYFGKMSLYFGPLTFVPGCSIFVTAECLVQQAMGQDRFSCSYVLLYPIYFLAGLLQLVVNIRMVMLMINMSI